MNGQRLLQQVIGIALVLGFLVGCSAPAVTPTPLPSATSVSTPATVSSTSRPISSTVPSSENRTDSLSDDEVATLSSLEQVDSYPLYTMHYYGAYNQWVSSAGRIERFVSENAPKPDLTALPAAWACSLFAALGDADHMLYGRNFDWVYSPAVLLFADPPDGYASVSMVDIADLGFEWAELKALTDLPLIGRRALLNAPFIPFDGMNERGLVVGMAAIPPGERSFDPDEQMRPDPEKETISSLRVIREMLDHASNVDEAVAILQSYNIDMGDGPLLHYLIADRSGRSVLVEFYQGELVVIPNEMPWHLATNFLRAAAGEPAERMCARYRRISQRLTEAEGRMTTQDAMDLLADVSQRLTQWSVVYGISTDDITVAMGKQYDNLHVFHLSHVGE